MNAIEPATPSRRITWFTLLGLVLVPAAIGGLLLWGLWDPTTRLGQVTAAVVNLDDGTEIDGQQVPLGRQLAAGLVTAEESNFTWVITDEEDAADGLDSGAYATVVTIPEDFSERALSFTGDAADAVQASLEVETTDRSRLVDGAISATITSTATTLFNRESATTYVEGLLGGFTELNGQLGEAADGAGELADGQRQLADGASGLADGLGGLSTGTDGLADGLGTLATGTAGLADGVGALADGAGQSAAGARDLAAGSRQVADGTAAFAGQLGQLADGAATAGGSARGAAQSTAQIVAALQAFQGLETCDFAGDPTCLQRLLAAVEGLPDPSILESLATDIATTDVALNGSSPLAPGQDVTGVVEGAGAASAGAQQLATGASGVADGATALADGLGALASGASEAANGAQQLAGGSAASASGARELADGTSALADGGAGLADGARTAADGGASLADGLDTAVSQIPTYTDEQAARLAAAGVEPIAAEAPGTDLFGASGVPLFATIAIWLGALAAYLLLRPVTSRALASTRSSLRLALGGYLPGLAIGVVQGLALGAVMLPVLEVSAAASVGFLAFAALTGAAFAAVNQGLAGLLGGFGRFLSMLVAVVALAAGIVSTVPPVFDAVLDVLPLTAAIDGMRAIAEGSAGAGPAVAAMIAWLLLGVALTVLAVARRRSAPLGSLRTRPVAVAG